MGREERDKESGGAREGDHVALRNDPTTGEQITDESPWEGLDGSAELVADTVACQQNPSGLT